MSLNTDNVRVAITGGVRVAPPGTALPTTPVATYNAAFDELGYLSEDGITEANSDDRTVIKAWQNGTTVRRVLSSTETTFAFTVIETNPVVWALYYPGSELAAVAAGDAVHTTLTVKVPAADPRAFAFDVLDGDSAQRILVPKGEISERGDVVYKNDEPIGYEMTMTCYPDEDGVVMIKLTNDDAFASLVAP